MPSRAARGSPQVLMMALPVAAPMNVAVAAPSEAKLIAYEAVAIGRSPALAHPSACAAHPFSASPAKRIKPASRFERNSFSAVAGLAPSMRETCQARCRL